ncbi:hypothetical protein [Empedobacter brevis]|uniref:hypothetical protein n=1 Tax=Empedobacter brevis TaxID=247 RepID=UPI00333F4BBF
MKENGRIIGLSFLLCFIGFLTRDFFLSYSMTVITGENMLFDKSWELPYQSFPLAVFIFSFGIIPFLYLLVKKVCKLTTPTSQYVSIILIITSGLLFYALRILYLKVKAAKIHDLLQRAEFAEGAEIPSIRFEEVNLEIYLLTGLIAGTLLSILMYRKKAGKGVEK